MNPYLEAHRQLRRDLAEIPYTSFFREMRQAVEDGAASAQGAGVPVIVRPSSVTISESIPSKVLSDAPAVFHTPKRSAFEPLANSTK